MEGLKVFATLSGQWRRKKDGTLSVWCDINSLKLRSLNSSMAKIWLQIDGVKTVDQIVDAIQGATAISPKISWDQIVQALKDLQEVGLVYEVGRVWADGLIK